MDGIFSRGQSGCWDVPKSNGLNITLMVTVTDPGFPRREGGTAGFGAKTYYFLPKTALK